MRTRAQLWLPLLMTCAGCDASYAVTGTVVTKGSGAPVEGAEIQITCPKGVTLEGKSNASGKFDAYGRTGIMPVAGCTLNAKKAGFSAASLPVDTCSSQWVSCTRDVGRVELVATP